MGFRRPHSAPQKGQLGACHGELGALLFLLSEICISYGWRAPAYSQTETYQVTRDAPTHGTDGPLKVSSGSIFLDFGHQYLQVVGELDPTRTREPPDTDTNDLKTINVYTVGLPLYTSRCRLPSHVSFT